MRGAVYQWLRQALLSQRSFIFHNAVKPWQAADCNRMAPAFWCNVWYSPLAYERAFCLYLVKQGENSSEKGVGASTQPDTFNLHQLCLQWGKHFLKEVLAIAVVISAPHWYSFASPPACSHSHQTAREDFAASLSSVLTVVLVSGWIQP